MSQVMLTSDGLEILNDDGEKTAIYTNDGKKFLKANELRTKDLYGNSWYVYSEKGTATYDLVSDMTYLVTFAGRNTSSSEDDAIWLVSAHKNASHLYAIKTSKSTTASIQGLKLTIARGIIYGRVSITRLT